MKAPKSLNTKLSEIQADFGVGLEFAGLIYPDSSSSAAIIPLKIFVTTVSRLGFPS